MRRANDLAGGDRVVSARRGGGASCCNLLVRRHRSWSCKGACGSRFRDESFLYVHARLPSGEVVAMRMRLTDGYILGCYRNRRARNACGLHAYRDRPRSPQLACAFHA